MSLTTSANSINTFPPLERRLRREDMQSFKAERGSKADKRPRGRALYMLHLQVRQVQRCHLSRHPLVGVAGERRAFLIQALN